MAKTVNPALFIGLGGTGHKVLMQVKEAVLKNYGETPPMVKILCFDTDRKELLSSSREIEYNKKLKDSDGNNVMKFVSEEIKFSPNEAVGIPIENPKGLASQDYIKSWLNDSVARLIGPSDTGAKQTRQIGRFAIFENYNKERIADLIQDRINELKNITQSRSTDYTLGDSKAKPCIHLVFSPCGGTGAGTFIDIMMIIKSIDPQISVYGYLVMPEFYTGFPFTTSVVQNAYTSLKEIDHLMGTDLINSTTFPWANYIIEDKKISNPFQVDFVGNGNLNQLTSGQGSFFDYLYLFDNINESGRFIEKVDDMYDRIGRILYMSISGAGTSMLSRYSNNFDYRYPSSDKTFNKRRNYSSMGISEIILNRKFLKDLKKNQASRIILNAYCYELQLLSQETLNTFIDENQWREDSGKDFLIDQLMPRNLLKYSIDTLYPEFKKGSHMELKLNVDNFLKQWDERCLTNTRTVREQVFDDFDKKIKDRVNGYLKSKGGISLCKQFLTFMHGSFQGMSVEMDTEVTAHKLNKEKLSKDVPVYIESIKNEEESFSLFNKEKNIRGASEVFVANAEKILMENWQIARKEAAKLFYDTSIEIVRGFEKQIMDLEKFLLEVLTDIETEGQKLRNESKNERDFERSIHYFCKELITEKVDDVNVEEAFRNLDFSDLINYKSVSDIKSFIHTYIETTDALKRIDSLEIETLLKSLDKDILNNIIQYLDLSSGVCIDIDQSFLLTTGKATMEKFGFICIPDDTNTVFSSGGQFHSQLSAQGGYTELHTYSTGDRDKISMIKIAGMFPACSIKRIQDYKSKFDSSPLYHYSDLYFEKYAFDLIDGPSDETESQLYFTVGSAIGNIKLHNAALVIEVDGGEKKPLYEGTRDKTNRFVASKIFAKNKEYTTYIKNLIDRKETEKGKEFVYQELLKFYKEITSVAVLGKVFDSMDKQKDEYKNIFEEKKILKAHILERCNTVYRESDFQ